MTEHPLLRCVYHGIDRLKAYVESEEAQGRSVDWNFRDVEGWLDDETGRRYNDVCYVLTAVSR